MASEFQDTAVLPGLPLLPPVASPILPSLHVELAQFGLELNLDWNWIWVMVSTVVLTVISMLVGMLLWRRWNGTGAYASSTGSAGSSNGSLIRSNTTHVSDTMFVVGKIEFNPTQLLGRGCDGTCVFRGRPLIPCSVSFEFMCRIALLREICSTVDWLEMPEPCGAGGFSLVADFCCMELVFSGFEMVLNFW